MTEEQVVTDTTATISYGAIKTSPQLIDLEKNDIEPVDANKKSILTMRWFHLVILAAAVFTYLLYRYGDAALDPEEHLLNQAIRVGPPPSLASYQSTGKKYQNVLATLPQKHIPGHAKHHRKGRLIVVGDVHGMRKSLEKLLAKLDFDDHLDHLILAGDMINKGPDSKGVIELAMDLGATGVRGNHEDNLLSAYEAYRANQAEADQDSSTEESADADLSTTRNRKKTKKLIKLAKKFSKKQIEWLQNCPVILHVGPVQGLGDMVVVHGGLVPSLSLERQNPHMVMNMRSIQLGSWIPSADHARNRKWRWNKKWHWLKKGEKPKAKTSDELMNETADDEANASRNKKMSAAWFSLWNKYQATQSAADRKFVVYGHDAKMGLQEHKYSRGLDTGCVNGGKLTALVIGVHDSGKKEGKVYDERVSVNC